MKVAAIENLVSQLKEINELLDSAPVKEVSVDLADAIDDLRMVAGQVQSTASHLLDEIAG